MPSVVSSQPPNYDLIYDSNLLSEFATLATTSVTAYQDVASNTYNLTLGASSNVIIEAYDGINVIFDSNSALTMYNYGFDSNDVRFDTEILKIQNLLDQTLITASTNALSISGGDASSTTTIAHTTLADTSNYQSFSTTKDAFQLTNPVYMKSDLTVNNSIIGYDNLSIAGNVFTSTMNLYKAKTPNEQNSNMTQVAYAFHINQYDQLELLKYVKSGTSNETSAMNQIWTFGPKVASPYVDAASNYDVMNQFIGLSNVSSGKASGSSTAVWFTALTSNDIYYTVGNIGIGTIAPKAPLHVQGDALFSGDIVADSNARRTIGSAIKRFLNVYTSNIDAYGDINFTGSLFKNGSPYKSSQWATIGSNVSITNSNVGIGTSNPEFTLDISGTMKHNNTINKTYSKILAHATGDYTNICTVAAVYDSSVMIHLDVVSQNSVKSYTIPVQIPPYNAQTAGEYFVINPIQGIGQLTLMDEWQLEIAYHSSPSFLDNTAGGNYLRMVRSANVPYAYRNDTFEYTINVTLSYNTTYPAILMDDTQTGVSASNVGLYMTSVLNQNFNKVGVNMFTNPQHTLDVNGDINFTGALLQNGGAFLDSQWKNAGASLYIMDSNVGMGVSEVVSKLYVGIDFKATSATINQDMTIYDVLNNGTVTTVGGNILPLSNLMYDLGSSDMRFRTLYIASNTIDMEGVKLTVDAETGGLKVTDSNNMRTILSVAELHIGAESNVTKISINSSNSITFSSITLSNGISISSNQATIIGSSLWSQSNSNIYLMNSNVGIGLSNPSYLVDINGSVNALGYCNLLVNDFASISTTNAPTASNLTVIYNNALSASNIVATVANASTYSSNIATTVSNITVSTSNIAASASNKAVFSSNTAISASNIALFSSNTAIFSSNIGIYSSNTAVSASLTAVFSSNTAIFSSNIAVSTSNTSIATSNSLITVSDKAIFASNAAISASNISVTACNIAIYTSNQLFATCNVQFSNVTVTGNLLASQHAINNIGDSNKWFGKAYIETLYLGSNTLYLGNTPILGTSGATINMHADADQNINVQTTGVGYTQLTSTRGINMTSSGSNAEVLIQSTGIGGKITFGAVSSIAFTAPTSTIHGNTNVTQGLTVTGDLTVLGSNLTIDSQIVQMEDNIILLNKGEVGNGVTAGQSGIRIDRGDLNDYMMVFDEPSKTMQAGQLGTLSTVAMRDWTSLNNLNANSNLSDLPSTNAARNNLTLGSACNATFCNITIDSVTANSFTNLVNNAASTSIILPPTANALKTVNDLAVWDSNTAVGVSNMMVETLNSYILTSNMSIFSSNSVIETSNNLTSISNLAIYASNLSIWSSNASVGTSNKLTGVSNTAIYSSNEVVFASNISIWNSNITIDVSNIVVTMSNKTYFSSNINIQNSNNTIGVSSLVMNVSNIAYVASVSAVFASNLSVWSSNIIISSSNNAKNSLTNSIYASNTAINIADISVYSSNIAMPESNASAYSSNSAVNASNRFNFGKIRSYPSDTQYIEITGVDNNALWLNAVGPALSGLNITVQNSNIMYISPSNIGIGINNPTQKLTVGGRIGLSNFGDIFLATSNANIGINTSNPAYKLDVNGAINASGYCNLLLDSTSNASTFNAPTANALYNVYTPISFTSNTVISSSNLGVWNSNAIIGDSNRINATSNTAIFSSNKAVYASNISYSNSNVIFSISNNLTGVSNAAIFSSNSSVFSSNTGAWNSNTVISLSNIAWNSSNKTFYNLALSNATTVSGALTTTNGTTTHSNDLVVHGTTTLNGLTASNSTIGGVSLSNGLVNSVDITLLSQIATPSASVTSNALQSIQSISTPLLTTYVPDNYWNSVAYGNGVIVAVATDGVGNRVMTSVDGITWTARTSAADNSWNSVAWGSSNFAAVASTGTGNRVMTSPDGITWTSRSSAADNTWISVCYGSGLGAGAGRFVAVGSSGTNTRVMTSDDEGVTWTIRTSAADNSWTSVCYGGGKFVAVGASGTGNRVMTSTDGITWTSQTSAADYNWQSVCYGNSTYVAVANSGANRTMSSPDGVTWTVRTIVSVLYKTVIYANNVFVALGQYTTASTSSDGITWTTITTPYGFWSGICWTGIIFSAVGYDGNGNRTMISKDGTTWSSTTMAADNEYTGVAYGAGLFVVIAQTGTGARVITSPDGTIWTQRLTPADNTWKSVCYGNGLFVVVSTNGTGNRVMTSPDGITWTSRTSAANNSWTSVCYGNGLFVAVSSNGTGNRVMTSSDGITWTSRSTTGADYTWLGVTYGNGVYVAVSNSGEPGRVMYSSNGEVWNLTTVPTTIGSLTGAITFGNGLFVALASGGTTTTRAMSSSDGVTWVTNTTPNYTSGWSSVVWTGTKFVAVANVAFTANQRVMTSTNGTTWTGVTTTVDNNWSGIAFGNSTVVAVASSGPHNRAMTSVDSGATWTIRDTTVFTDYSDYRSVCWASQLKMFAAVAYTASDTYRIVTSLDGINWTLRDAGQIGYLTSICWSGSLFVVVSAGLGTNNRVITSSNGITWTTRTSAADNVWTSVTYGNGLFVAVASSGTGNRVMTSSDGITWTSRTSAADNTWTSVTYGNSIFVAVASSGTGNRVMTSSDGITWTTRTSAANNSWTSVTYGYDKFVAVAASGTGNRVMTSSDGITWTIRTSAADNNWRSVAWSSLFSTYLALASSGSPGTRAMTSTDGITWVTLSNAIADNGWNSVCWAQELAMFTAVAGFTDSGIIISNKAAKSLINTASSYNTVYAAPTQLSVSQTTGYVGIGTTTPSNNLDVSGAINALGYCNLLINSSSNASTSNAPTTNALSNINAAVLVNSNVLYGVSNTVYPTASIFASISNVWKVNSSNIYNIGSNIGIGTMFPESILHVSKGNIILDDMSNTTRGINLSMSNAASSAVGIYVKMGNSAFNGRDQGILVISNSNNTSNALPYTGIIRSHITHCNWNAFNATMGKNNRVIFQVEGNPATSNSSITLNSASNLTNSTIIYGNVGINNSNNTNTLTISGNASIGTTYATKTAPSNGMIVQGNVGIGMSNPTQSVSVGGNVTTTSNLYIGSNVGPNQSNNIDFTGNTGNIVCSGNISAGNLGMFRNRIINGNMRVNQRGANTLVTTTGTASNAYLIDRFVAQYSNVTVGALTQSNVTLTSSDSPYQYGFRNSYKVAASTACTYSSIMPCQNVEGNYIEDFNWGTAFGMPTSLSMWMRTNVATNGKIPITLRNAASNYVYNTEIVVASTGNWQYIATSIPAPPNGSAWLTESNAGVQLIIGGYQTTGAGLTQTSNSWINSNCVGTSNSTNIWGTLNNYVEVTGVQLEKGTISTPFEFRPYPTELQLCQRYCVNYSSTGAASQRLLLAAAGNGSLNTLIQFPVQMRKTPTLTTNYVGSNIANSNNNGGVSGVTLTATTGFGLNGSDTTSIAGGIFATCTSTITTPFPCYINPNSNLYIRFEADF